MREIEHPISRRTWFAGVVASTLAISSFTGGASPAFAQFGAEGFDSNEAEMMLDLNTVELSIQLRNGLRVFLPEQEAFLNKVVHAVDTKQLPRAMVTMVYVWAIKRNKRVPFPYFEFAMRALAERRGVIL